MDIVTRERNFAVGENEVGRNNVSMISFIFGIKHRTVYYLIDVIRVE